MKAINLIISLIFPFLLIAQNDEEAKILFDKALNKINSYKGIESKFLFEVSEGENAPKEQYRGTIQLKGSKFRFETGESIIFSDGKTRWVLLQEEKEVNISNQISAEGLEPEARLMNAPLSLFEIYKDGFKYSFQGTVTEDGANYQVADISPTNKEKPYFKIRYWFNEDFTPYRVKIFQKDGKRISFTITDFNENGKLKEDIFKFDSKKYPDVEVIDLRD